MNKNTLAIIYSIGLVVFFAASNFFLLMPLSPRFGSTMIYYALMVGFLIIGIKTDLFEAMKNGGFHKKVLPNGRERVVPDEETMIILRKIGVVAAIFIVGFAVVYGLVSSPVLRSQAYTELVNPIIQTDAEFESDFPNLDTAEIDGLPIVDRDYGSQLADKALGEVAGLGSEYHVGELSDIIYKGEQYLVAPLEYNGMFKWFNNKSNGTPGYILVNKQTEATQLVRKDENGNSLGLKYMPSAYLLQNLDRHVYFSGNMVNRNYRTFFEIDEEGRPFWITVKTKPTIGINGGLDVYEIVVTDAQTGENKNVEIKDLDSYGWIDNVYPKELVVSHIDSWGKYVNGFFNSFLGQKDVITSTDGSRRIKSDSDEMLHFTGLTSAGADNSTVGFVTINTRTKLVKRYNNEGTTENAAMSAAEGLVQDQGYEATFPIPIRVSDKYTYFITLKDDNGLLKGYSLVNVKSFDKLVYDTNVTNIKGKYDATAGGTASYFEGMTFGSERSFNLGNNTWYEYQVSGTKCGPTPDEALNSPVSCVDQGKDGTAYVYILSSLEFEFQKSSQGSATAAIKKGKLDTTTGIISEIVYN